MRGLANIYRAQSPEKATQFIQSLSASQRRSIDDIERSLTNEQLSAQAEQLGSEGKYAQAAEIQRRRLALSPGDVWITYRLSRDLYSAGQRSQADKPDASAGEPETGAIRIRFTPAGCTCPVTIRPGGAGASETLPRDKWNGNIQALADRLQSNQVLETANRLRDSGKEQEAETLLRQQPPSTRIDLTLADWAEQRGDHEAAKTAYNTILQREPQNEDAILGLTEVYLAQGNKEAARAALAKLPAAQNGEPLSLNMQRRLAMAQAGLG